MIVKLLEQIKNELKIYAEQPHGGFPSVDTGYNTGKTLLIFIDKNINVKRVDVYSDENRTQLITSYSDESGINVLSLTNVPTTENTESVYFRIYDDINGTNALGFNITTSTSFNSYGNYNEKWVLYTSNGKTGDYGICAFY